MRIRFRLSVFDLGILLMALMTVWVAATAYQTLRQLAAGRARFNAMQGAVGTRELAKSREGAKLKDIFAMKDLTDLRQHYFSMSEQVERSVGALEKILHDFATTKNREQLRQFQTESERFTRWLQNQKTRIEPLKHRQLSDWLSEKEVTATNGGALPRTDVSDLLEAIRTTFTQYLAQADYVGKNAGHPFIRDQVSHRLQAAESEANRMRELAKQIRTKGQAIESFLETQSTQLSQDERQEIQTAKASGQDLIAWVDQLESRSQRVLLVASLAVLGLCVLLTVAVYHRVEGPDRAKTERQKILAQFGTFAGSLAHEIRNPLTAINARLHVLQKSLAADSAEHKDATLIRNEISRLDQIVKDFLLLARPAEPKLAPITAEPILQEVKDLLEPQCAKHGVELILESAVPTRFWADPQQLKQVLINLIQNAADSIEGKGTVTLRARAGKVWFTTGQTEAVEIDVQDTGAGIPAEVKEKIFQPFFSTKQHGTGLGLPISARIVEQHGGRLEFDSEVGQGTVFRVVLPASS